VDTRRRASPERTDRRDEVADAAIEAIADVGFERASLREIAGRLGTTIGVLTHQFRDRDELLAYAFTTATNRIKERSDRAAQQEDAFVGVVEMLLEALPLDQRSRRETAVWLAFSTAAMTHPELAALHSRVYHNWTERLADRLSAIESHIDTRVVARLLIATVDGIALRMMSSGTHSKVAAVRPLLEHALRVHLPPPTSGKSKRTRRNGVPPEVG
jgi:AcrR family transcriptional regulator